MTAKVIFKHPSVRRFKTAVSLTGETLTQELTGMQQRSVHSILCTAEDYTNLVRDAEASEFLEGLQANASEQVHFGIELFDVQIAGSRKLAPGVTDDAEYVYSSEC